MSTATYPVRVEAHLDDHLSRWLWLVKWLLAVPHYVVLAFLWTAFAVLSVVAFFAILFSGRYPRSIFDFNVGVMRWTWRVSYYAYGALATDKYPPFTLEEAPDYPAHLEIAYPEHLSRGLVLVKWWLLAIPHYLIVGVLVGGGWFAVDNGSWTWSGGGVITLLAIVAALMLALTAKYPAGLFDFILGLNRWVLRVAAYAGLMTDEYPPFRLDMGGSEAGVAIPQERPVATASPAASAKWGGGRITALVLGALLLLPSFGSVVAGGATLWADVVSRDGGYLTTGLERFDTATYAVATDRIELPVEGPSWVRTSRLVGTIRLRVIPTTDGETFVGIARTEDVERYLAGVAHAVTTGLGSEDRTISGGAPATPPAAQDFWVATSTGTGDRALTWRARGGTWTAVAMNADGSRGVSIRASIGATLPALRAIAVGLLVGGGVFFIVGLGFVIGAVTYKRRPVATAREEAAQ